MTHSKNNGLRSNRKRGNIMRVTKAIKEYIVTLELGGTRAELEEMLNNLRGV